MYVCAACIQHHRTTTAGTLQLESPTPVRCGMLQNHPKPHGPHSGPIPYSGRTDRLIDYRTQEDPCSKGNQRNTQAKVCQSELVHQRLSPGGIHAMESMVRPCTRHPGTPHVAGSSDVASWVELGSFVAAFVHACVGPRKWMSLTRISLQCCVD